MINRILHHPPHLSNQTEIRLAELLRGLADSPHPWPVIWGYNEQNPSSPAGENPASALPPTAMHFDAFTALVHDPDNPPILMEGRRSIPEPAAPHPKHHHLPPRPFATFAPHPLLFH
jgi:hypothetical protein